MTKRPARGGERGMATGELAIVSVLILIVAAIAIPIFLRIQGRPLRCLDSLLAGADGRLPPDATCPVSGRPYASVAKGGVERLQCPDPSRHLAGQPRLEKSAGGTWRFRADPPGSPEPATPYIGRTASFVQGATAGETVVVEIRPRFWYRYIVGPLLQLFALMAVITAGVNLLFLRKETSPSILVVVSVFGLLGGTFLCLLAPGVEGSESIAFHPREGRAVHHRYLFGAEPTAPTVIENCEGLCLLKREQAFTVVLVGKRDGRWAGDPLFGCAESDLGFVTWLSTRVLQHR